MMTIHAVALALLVQQPPVAPTPDLAVISARLGPCSADFTVTDAQGKPIYAAIVGVRIRYGFLGIKRMNLEVGTNSDGKARVDGLPARARPLVYDVWKGEAKTSVGQDLSTNCRATYAVSLK